MQIIEFRFFFVCKFLVKNGEVLYFDNNNVVDGDNNHCCKTTGNRT